MSIIRCKKCERSVDTDFHETYGPNGDICECCATWNGYDPMYCGVCDHYEFDEIFLDTETCSQCGGLLDCCDAPPDPDTIEADQGQFGVGA